MTKKRILLVVFVVIALFLSTCQSTTTSVEETIRIGMTAPLTGPTAESGIALGQGAEIAAAEINASGGVQVGGKLYTIELIVEDNEGKPEVGVAAAEKLITKDKVHYLIGDSILSSVTMAIMELAPKYNIPIVSGESVSEAIVDKVVSNPDRYQYYWKMNFGSTTYADTIFNTVIWLVDTGKFEVKTEKIFFVVEDTDYGRSNASAAAVLFEGIGWSVSSIETVQVGNTEFYPQLSKARESGADVVVSIFTPLSSGVSFVKQFQELDIDSLHIAIYYPSRPEFYKQAGQASEGLLWSPLIFSPDQNEVHRDFAEKVRMKFSVEPTIDHAYGYDFVNNAVDSIVRSGSLEPSEIIDAVSQLDRKGIIGRYAFDQFTHQIKSGPDFLPVPMAQIQGGKSYLVWPEEFSTSEFQPQD